MITNKIRCLSLAMLFVWLPLLSSALAENLDPVSATFLPPRATQGPKLFELLSPAQSGLVFSNKLERANHRRYIETGSGVAIGDFDGDGKPDVFLAGTDSPSKLFRQTAPFKFEDVSAKTGIEQKATWATGATFVDIDGNGTLDLYVCNRDAANQLYINQGDGTFKEEAKRAGLDFAGPSYVGSFADYDRDGDLDMYLLNYRLYPAARELKGSAKLQMKNGKLTVPTEYEEHFMLLGNKLTEVGKRDVLFRNNGDGTFEDVSDAAGISGFDMGLSVTWWDYDRDGWLDIYIGNDLKTPDHLYRNNGDGTFTDVIAESVSHTPWFSMGADFADINNDGFFDLLVADMSSTTHYKQKVNMGDMADSGWFLNYGKPRQYMRNTLFLGTGTSRFLEAAYMSGLDSTDWTWAVRFADFNNDGLSDVYFTNGMSRHSGHADINNELSAIRKESGEEKELEKARNMPALKENNLVFQNTGDLSFADVSAAWGLDHFGISHGAATGDLDGDGDLDLVVNNLNENALLYRNTSNTGNSVIIHLRGTKQNYHGIGATVEIEANGQRQIQQLIPVRGYISSSEPIIHFGLGDAKRVSKLTVSWPSGAQQTINNLKVNQVYTIRERDDSGLLRARLANNSDERETSEAMFEPFEETTRLKVRHRERNFDDYEREPLLPYKLSQFGPPIAASDVNGDGRIDFYMGGSASGSGAIFTQTESGRYKSLKGPWREDKAPEDVAALFFDADADGDEDLYVVSGSNEFEAASANYHDRLYWNDGKGNFTKAGKDELPEFAESGSSACAGDYDKDGDLDLFVGSRSVPGNYSKTPKSYLLQNDKGRFSFANDETAPGLATTGMVTGCQWSDVNGDSWTDLLLSRDWKAPAVFINNKGTLRDSTAESGLASYRGWWNNIAVGDFDADGDPDFIVTNLGLNTKYYASKKKPLRIYASDFDGNQKLDLVEAKFEGDIEYPIRGRSCSTNAMPFVGEKFPTYDAFARAALGDIYNDLNNAEVLEATYLSSALLINDGKGHFEVRELPRLAQISPGYGIAVADYDQNGTLDAFIAQNFFGPQVETGYMDGGLGLMLLGDGRGNFRALSPEESGIVIPEDSVVALAQDIDRDGAKDLIVSTNGGQLRVYRNRKGK